MIQNYVDVVDVDDDSEEPPTAIQHITGSSNMFNTPMDPEEGMILNDFDLI